MFIQGGISVGNRYAFALPRSSQRLYGLDSCLYLIHSSWFLPKISSGVCRSQPLKPAHLFRRKKTGKSVQKIWQAHCAMPTHSSYLVMVCFVVNNVLTILGDGTENTGSYHKMTSLSWNNTEMHHGNQHWMTSRRQSWGSACVHKIPLKCSMMPGLESQIWIQEVEFISLLCCSAKHV